MSDHRDTINAQAAHAPTDAATVRADTALALVDGFRATDVGNADRLVAAADGLIRHVHRWGKWIVYDDGRWVIDYGNALMAQRARDVARNIFRVGVELDDKIRDRHYQWAKASERASAIANMIHLARGTPGVLIDHHQLDTRPWLLNVVNGTLDLRTGVLHPHDPDDLLTVQAPVVYDPDATAPLWEHCLQRWQPGHDARRYLQRAVGTGLAGHPLENLFVNVGVGSNGKTKFFEAVMHVLGGYAVTPAKGVFVLTRHEDHKTELASLFGARMIVLPETEQHDRLNEAQVKNLTGGDTITCRRMREDEWTFAPTHTAFMHTNYRPRITGADAGIWRRVRLIPWGTTISGDEIDEGLGAKLQAEGSGILNWLLAGCLHWQRVGLAEPDGITSATDGYRSEQDHVGRFIDDQLVVDPTGRIGFARLWELYEQWCEAVGEDPQGKTAVGLELNRRGFDSVKVGGGSIVRHGLREP